MLVFFQLAGQDLLIAFLCMLVAFRLFQTTGKLPHGLVTVFRVGMAFSFLKSAYQLCDLFVALRSMGMLFVLFQVTDQVVVGLVAFLVVGVAF